jgi:gamma-tubulin complex component 2
MVPIFLSKYKEKILFAGKYLNVIRECGRHDIQNPYEQELGAKGPAGFSFNRKVIVVNQGQSGVIYSVDQSMDRGDVEMASVNDENKEQTINTGDQQNAVHQQQYEFYEPIEKSYEWNSAKLLEVIFNDCQLVERLHSMKHYFFMDRGDFFSHFVDGAEDVIEQKV